MKAVSLFLFGILLFGAGVSAQEALPLDGAEQRVTKLIREALRSPDAPENWAGLAQGLSVLESMDPARGIGLEAAIRVADSLAFSPLLARTDLPDTQAQGVGTETLFGTITGTLMGFAGGLLGDPMAALSLFGLLMGGWILLGKSWRVMVRLGLDQRLRRIWTLLNPIRRISDFTEVVSGVARVAAGGGDRRMAQAPHRPDPREQVVALSKHGIPANEISRQTGLAQDEVAVVLALRTQAGSFGGADLSPHRRSA